MTSIERSITGPRSLRDPTSREYAIQTMRSLKRLLEMKTIDARRIEEELQLIVQHKHWQACGHQSLDAYLRAEIGSTHRQLKQRLAQDLAADPAVTAAAPKGTAGPGRGKTGNNVNRFKGNSAAYLVRRLKRDAPEIAQALARGEFKSARAAAKAAGLITEKTPFEKAAKAVAALSLDDWAKLKLDEDQRRQNAR